MQLKFRTKAKFYLGIDTKDDKKAVCSTCGKLISHGGSSVKNSTHLQYQLQQVHMAKQCWGSYFMKVIYYILLVTFTKK